MAFTKALEEAGIEQQFAVPYVHQQNGKAKQAIRTLKGCSLAMLKAAALPLTLWGEAILTATYLWNHTKSTVLPPGKTPDGMVNNKKPDLSHFRIFGLHCWACIPTKLQSKLRPKSRRALFMGYPEGVKGYRLYDTTSRAYFIAHDVTFNEDLVSAGDEEDKDKDESMPPLP